MAESSMLKDLPAQLALREATRKLGIDFAALVAEVGLWVAPEVHARNVTPLNPTGAVYAKVQRARGSGEKPSTIVAGIRLDSNNYAGQAIRAALGIPRAALAGYQACHVWPDSCYDARYHTALANLVLIPAPIVSLTDFDPDVIAALKYRSFELYGWHPLAEAPPPRPERFPTNWRSAVHGKGVRGLKVQGSSRSGASAPEGGGEIRHGLQRETMQRLWRLHHGEVPEVVRAWVEAAQSGAAKRQSNQRGQSDEQYAKRLIYDGRKKGWLK